MKLSRAEKCMGKEIKKYPQIGGLTRMLPKLRNLLKLLSAACSSVTPDGKMNPPLDLVKEKFTSLYFTPFYSHQLEFIYYPFSPQLLAVLAPGYT